MHKYFKSDEFTCKCCGSGEVDPLLISILDVVRARRECALKITSGYRCEKHNSEVGGVTNSYHTKGQAADIVPADGDVYSLAGELRSIAPANTCGIIIYSADGFVHFDIRAVEYSEVR